MTFQPPPVESGGTPAPPPPGSQPGGQWGPPPGGVPGRTGFDPKTINPLDWGVMGIGAVLFVFSFFDYYSFDYGFVSGSVGAWHWGGGLFVAWFAMVIGVLAAAATAISLFAPQINLPRPARQITVMGFAASFVLYVVAIFAHSDFGPNAGHGFSFWLSLVLALAGTGLSLMRLQQTGGQLPGGLNSRVPNVGGYGPQGGLSGGPGTQFGPPPGYGNPPPPPGYGNAPPPPPPGYGSTPPPPPPPGYGPPSGQ